MGFFSDLFLGSEGGGTGIPEHKVLDLSTLSPEQQELSKFLMPLLRQRAGEQVQPTNLENLSLSALEQMAMNAVGGDQSGTKQLGEAREATSDILSRGPTDFEDFFRSTIQEPALRSFEQDILPRINEQFAPQFFGGERREASSRATEDLLRSLTESRSGLAFQTRRQDTQDKLAAGGLAGNLFGLEERGTTDLLTALLAAGTGQRESIGGQQSQRISEALSFLGTPQRENVVLQEAFKSRRPGLLEKALSTGAEAAAFYGGKAAF